MAEGPKGEGPGGLGEGEKGRGLRRGGYRPKIWASEAMEQKSMCN